MKKKITIEDIQVLHNIFLRRIESIDPDRKAGLALSGGTDSLTILFSMLQTGRRPDCFTFFVENKVSPDLLSARKVCDFFGLSLNEVMIPKDSRQVISDIKTVLPYCQNTKKTVIQCMHPWVHLYPKIKQITNKVLNGLGGDDLYCNQRKVMVAISEYGEDSENVLSMRKVYSDDFNFSAANIIRYGKKAYHVENVDFYNTQEIEQWFLQFEVRSLHKPFEKFPSVQAFREYYDKSRFYRHHSSYQINSGLKQLHESLLNTSINTNKWKDVRPIYEKIRREFYGS